MAAAAAAAVAVVGGAEVAEVAAGAVAVAGLGHEPRTRASASKWLRGLTTRFNRVA
jgi:hypothetical protein